MRCEILARPCMIRRAKWMLSALARHCPWPAKIVMHPTGTADVLVVYGLGEPIRRAWWLEHLAAGRHGVGIDLGYWNRQGTDARMRFSVDADHPAIDRAYPLDRMRHDGIELRDDYDARGPIVLVGLGVKQVGKTGQPYQSWEQGMVRQIAEAYPVREIVYRPKSDPGAQLDGCRTVGGGKIEDVLRGASLAVMGHSNVALDACMANIPVVCDGGIASSLYGSDLAEPVLPAYHHRQQLLAAASYWQWSPSEAAACWHFLRQEIERA